MAPDNDDSIAWLSDVSPQDLRRIVGALRRVHYFMAHLTDCDMLLEHIMEAGKEVAHAEACSLMLYDAERDVLLIEVALGERGDQQALKREIQLKLNEGIAGVAAATREPVNVRDVSRDPRFCRRADETTHFKTHSVLAVPLIDRGTLIGVLEVVNKLDAGGFTEADINLMEMFSALAATAIANARLIEENLKAERLAAVGQAMAGLSHYTKNIVTGLRNSIDLIDDGLRKNDLELLRTGWPIFKRSTGRISDCVEDMLAFSKPCRPLHEVCDVAALLDEVAQTFWGLLARKHVALEVRADGVEGPVWVDTRGLFRCLLNLLINAAEAVQPDQGKIHVEARTTPEGTLHIEVEDNGPGVDEALAAKIFDPFFSTKGTNGTGLGLAVTRKILAEHGGDIQVLRGRDGGALFRVRIPGVHPPQ